MLFVGENIIYRLYIWGARFCSNETMIGAALGEFIMSVRLAVSMWVIRGRVAPRSRGEAVAGDAAVRAVPKLPAASLFRVGGPSP